MRLEIGYGSGLKEREVPQAFKIPSRWFFFSSFFSRGNGRGRGKMERWKDGKVGRWEDGNFWVGGVGESVENTLGSFKLVLLRYCLLFTVCNVRTPGSLKCKCI